MTDKLPHSPLNPEQAHVEHPVHSQSQVWLQKIDLYSEKDVEDAKRFAVDASKILGKLEIDHKAGISRHEILEAAARKNVSARDDRVYMGLANMEPNVQAAWQVPNHRAHLKDSSEAQFYSTAGQLLARGGQTSWSEKLSARGAQLGDKAKHELNIDRSKQTDIYFNQADVSPAKLKQLNEQIGRVEVAVQVLPHSRQIADALIKKFDKSGDGLSPADVRVGLNRQNISHSDKVLLTAIAQGQQGQTLKGPELERLLQDWAAGESRADKQNKEGIFFAAIEGYHGHGIGIKSQERFNREMDAKDGSQLADYERANDGRSVPQ